MMQTRRKSRATTSDDPNAATQSLHIPVPEDLDEDTVSEILPELNLGNVMQEDVVNLLRLLVDYVAKVDAAERDRDEARAEIERKDVELDQALQDKESATKDLDSTLESLQEEVAQVKEQNTQLSKDRDALQAKLNNLSTTQASSSTEVEALKHRVEDTEREKRELMGVISRLKDEAAQRDDEIHTLRSKLKEARQEHQDLEGQVRELNSSATANKFKIDSLTNQLQLTQSELDRTNSELNEKAEEFTKYRRTKHAEFATLQAQFDSLSQSQSSAEASFKALQSAHTSQSHQLTQALSKIQALTGQLAEQEARYSNEANGLKRLVAMMEEREKQAKDIVDNVEREWALVGEKSERREAALKEEIEAEKKRREEAEKRAEQLETVLERVNRGELQMPAMGTPLRGVQDPLGDALSGLSPTVAIASRVQRTGKTFTEIFTDYVRLQEEYDRKVAECDQMDRTLTSVLAQIEERAPILKQQRTEYERLQSEASHLASQLAQTITERDTQAKTAQDQGQKLAKALKEIDMLQKSLDDTGRQVQGLLREIARRDDPTIPSDEELAAAGLQPATDTETLITNHLVKFVSIDQLQEQNQRLLKIVREMGEKMESEEREYKETMEREQAEAIREAHEAMQELAEQLERQKKSADGIIQAHIRERDTLRAMLARAEKAGGRVITNGGDVAMEASDSELAKELAEVQTQFDAYKTEMGVDSNRLREELSAAQRECNSLGASLAKANAKIEYMSDRARMHEEQLQIQNREVAELSKRNHQLLDQWTRLDIECNRVSDDLQSATSRIEQLRNECANLRAEKKIWEGIQNRLVEENRTLAMERSHLSDLMANVQKMHNDLERSGENDRRRLESQLQMFENQAQDLKIQLNQERDNSRHISLQKDIELKEIQTRLEKTVQEMSKTRENLIEAQTSRKHLEERVDNLSRQLTVSEEKLSVYERRSGSTFIQQPDPDLSREQQLEAEVADLRSLLKVTEADLAAARSHKDQFQEISRASEAALADLSNTFDEYKASAEATIARHESERSALQEKLDAAVAELNQIKAQFNEAQKTFETERTAWINDKKTLEDTIVDMTNSEKTSESDRSTREYEIRSIEDRAKSAEEKYSQEVIAHAETLKAIDNLKKDLSTSQAAARENLSAAETAKAKLSSSEASWNLQKAALDKEVTDLNARCQDLVAQNATLHQHLESVSTQAARIRQAADAAPDSTTESDGSDADTRLSELRAVVTYLRKEKSIVDLQLEMSRQENGRLKSHIEHLNQSLQETRNTLAEEREKAVENTASAAQHAELVERINQLNILRESNATLRTDCESASKKARDLETKLAQLSLELEPAKEQARSAVAELEVTKGQMIRLEQESKRWQQRNAQLLSKYDRVDPAEIQSLKDELARATAEKDALAEEKKVLVEEKAALALKAEAIEASEKKTRETGSRNLATFKSKMASWTAERTNFNAAQEKLAAEKKELEAKIEALEAQVQAAQQAPPPTVTPPAAAEEVAKQAQLIESLQAERDKLIAERDAALKARATAAPIATSSNGADVEELTKTRDEALKKSEALTNEMKMQQDKFQARIRDLMKSKAELAERQQTALNEAIQKAKADATSSAPSVNLDEINKRHAEELRALEEKLKAETEARVKAAIEASSKSNPSGESEADQKARIEAAIKEHEQKLQSKHAEEISAAVERGRLEAGAKGRLKDAQLLKAQKRVKDLEAQMLAAGLQPAATVTTAAAANAPTPAATADNASTAPTSPIKATTPANPITTPAAATPATTTAPTPAAKAAPAVSASAGPSGGLPRRPGGGPPTAPTRGAAPRGRGGRGGQPQRVPPVKQASQASVTPPPPATGGMSIMGAATKRPREEGQPVDDSLAKRLKPAGS